MGSCVLFYQYCVGFTILPLVYTRIFGGLKAGIFSAGKIYGKEALVDALFWNLLGLTIFPILPISLTYIIVYSILKRKEKTNNTKVN